MNRIVGNGYDRSAGSASEQNAPMRIRTSNKSVILSDRRESKDDKAAKHSQYSSIFTKKAAAKCFAAAFQTVKKPSGAGAPQTLPPGGSCHWAAPKSRPMTEEECGRKFWSTGMLGLAGCFINIQPYFRPISCTNFQITARIPLPTRFFRTSFGRATLPPGEGISLRRDFFDKLKTPVSGETGVLGTILA